MANTAGKTTASVQTKRAQRKRTAKQRMLLGSALFVSGCVVSLMIAAFGPMVSAFVGERPRNGFIEPGAWGDKYAVHLELIVIDNGDGPIPSPVSAEREASLRTLPQVRGFIDIGDLRPGAASPPLGPFSSRTTIMMYSGWPVHCLHGRVSTTLADAMKPAAALREMDGLIDVQGDFVRQAFIPKRPLSVGLVIDGVFWGAALYGTFRFGKALPRIVRVPLSGTCSECGYALTGLAERAQCPECGKRGKDTAV